MSNNLIVLMLKKVTFFYKFIDVTHTHLSIFFTAFDTFFVNSFEFKSLNVHHFVFQHPPRVTYTPHTLVVTT